MVIGSVAGLVCYFAVMLKNKLGWDDALDVWGVHGVGGMIGVIMLGLFADPLINVMVKEPGLLLSGNPVFFLKQCAAIILSSVYALGFTYGMLWVINRVTPVSLTREQEESGLDRVLHDEQAYETDVL